MPHAEINVPDLILVGRFSSDPHWPVLGDRWGTDYFANHDGSTAQNGPVDGNYAVSPNGRVVAFSVGAANTQVIYLVSDSSGYIILGVSGTEVAGYIGQQTPP